MKGIGMWNPRIRTVGIRNPDGRNPESRWLESGIQRVGIRNPKPLWILLHGAIYRYKAVELNSITGEGEGGWGLEFFSF